jgi:hypothetical protein
MAVRNSYNYEEIRDVVFGDLKAAENSNNGISD